MDALRFDDHQAGLAETGFHSRKPEGMANAERTMASKTKRRA
jgi:hypothetical protein